ncbi:SGNH/GDSL hydrolase family protein [Persicitalea jodogahamensis]|uniref:SGNH hydrolase-type esterase domain-containing protein n=1 Tax=Persicitalea jodogahamensis TaxID=402147 RepID=A0A8J3GCN7_9BACT|nr:SGNH/GDSL hydrolase family protein [Persicitalea jodogahamensis]GHB85820.1 hypothetical protein GCM10007390_46660 [Persicitalea jodogahamensis]
MKKVMKFWATLAGSLIVIWALFRGYDAQFGNDDALVGDINLDTLLKYLLVGVGLLAAATLGTRSRHGWLANGSASVCGLLLFWVLAETICFGLINLGLTDAPPPFHSRVRLNKNWVSYEKQFWGDISPEFGRWRLPNSSIRVPICNGDSVLLTSNSYGMRDAERQLASPGSTVRAVLLGDSFMEGYMVDAPLRYSNLLETKTGREHLNFGINGTSPINYYLTYKYLARQFEHEVVIVALLPANDFEDYSEAAKTGLLRYPIYRPYWEGNLPDLNLKYSLKNIDQSVAAPVNRQRPAQVQESVDSVFHSMPWGKRIAAELTLNSYAYAYAMNWVRKSANSHLEPMNSFASKSFVSRWAAFGHSLEELLKATQGKKVILLGMPVLSDVYAYEKVPEDDFSPKIQTLCHKYGATYINILPIVHRLGPKEWSSFYIPCDGHFSAKGEKLVANIILNDPVYREAMGLENAEECF